MEDFRVEYRDNHCEYRVGNWCTKNLKTINFAFLEHFCSLLNPNFRISCKAKNSDYFGSLIWDGKNCNEAIVEEMPRHALISKGDTIVTSGYSAVFPEGIAVGVITNFENSDNDNFHTLRVKLFTDFAKLSIVKVVSNRDINELKLLQPANNDTSK